MTKRQKAEHIKMLQSLLTATGFEQDRWSNWKQELESGTMRVKFKSTNIRIEFKYPRSKDWHKIVSKPIVKFDHTDIDRLLRVIRHYDTPKPAIIDNCPSPDQLYPNQTNV